MPEAQAQGKKRLRREKEGIAREPGQEDVFS